MDQTKQCIESILMEKLDPIQEKINPPQEPKAEGANPHEVFSLEELIRKLEDIRDGFGTGLNLAKAVYTLSCEIRAIKNSLDAFNLWMEEYGEGLHVRLLNVEEHVGLSVKDKKKRKDKK